MRIRKATGLLLAFSLLLASMVDLVGHEHVVGHALAGVECVTEHERGHEDHPESPEPHFTAAGERHEHHCVGCRVNGYRILLTSPLGPVGPDLAAEEWLSPRSFPGAVRPWTSYTVRGPPLA